MSPPPRERGQESIRSANGGAASGQGQTDSARVDRLDDSGFHGVRRAADGHIREHRILQLRRLRAVPLHDVGFARLDGFQVVLAECECQRAGALVEGCTLRKLPNENRKNDCRKMEKQCFSIVIYPYITFEKHRFSCSGAFLRRRQRTTGKPCEACRLHNFSQNLACVWIIFRNFGSAEVTGTRK